MPRLAGVWFLIQIEVREFGPIAEGTVQVKPLTVFVGPNNSGKSYLAMLLYALYRAFSGPAPYFFANPSGTRVFSRYLWYPTGFPSEPPDMTAIEALAEWMKDHGQVAEARDGVMFRDLPKLVQESLAKSVRDSAQSYLQGLQQELGRCFGTELSGLVRSPHGCQDFCLKVLHSSVSWDLTALCSDNHLEGNLGDFSLGGLRLDPRRTSGVIMRSARSGLVNQALEEMYFGFLADIQFQLFREFFHGVYYLPAARSGILQSHKALAGLLVSQASRAGIEPFNVPQMSGVVTDFIATVLQLQPRPDRPLAHLADVLEHDVIGGEIQLSSDNIRYPEIYYRPSSDSFPLHRTSSMVSELAPIALFLRYVVDPRDLLIIEEPESHLHPENQLRLAKVIVRLVRSKVKVLITTHSDYFLEQVNNYIRLGSLGVEERTKQGYAPDDYLRTADIGAYLFATSTTQSGSSVKELRVDSRDGITEQELGSVAEALYAETVKLDRRLTLREHA